MASEIRVNKINNRAGLGTVTYTDTGIIVSGIVTTTGVDITGGLSVANDINLGDNDRIQIGTHQDLQIYHDGSLSRIRDQGAGMLLIEGNVIQLGSVSNGNALLQARDALGVELYFANSKKFETTNTGAIVTGVLTATSFSGDGSSLSNLPAGAPVGGASTNTVFFENDNTIGVGYSVTSGKNAMSAGPLTINVGIAVTVPTGSSWTIV